MQGAHATQQIGEAFEVAGFLQLPAAHHRREAHDFRFRVPLPRNVGLEALDDLRVERSARVDAIDAHGSKQPFGDMSQRIGRGIDRGGRARTADSSHRSISH